MADMPFFSGYSSSGAGSKAKNYDDLQNRPVVNIVGDPVVISDLETGVYNIDGTWAMTVDSVPVDTKKDDLFYVDNDVERGVHLTWITADGMSSYQVKTGGNASDVIRDTVATVSTVAESMLGTF